MSQSKPRAPPRSAGHRKSVDVDNNSYQINAGSTSLEVPPIAMTAVPKQRSPQRSPRRRSVSPRKSDGKKAAGVDGEERETVGKLIGRNPRRDQRRSRSLYGVNPSYHFGPKGTLHKCANDSVLTIPDPSDLRLKWDFPPKVVLVIKKPSEDTVSQFKQLCTWLIQEKHMTVYVEEKELEDGLINGDQSFNDVKEKLSTFKDREDELSGRVDFIICLGGDGTLLYASTLFQSSMPPVLSFQMGSLGFLTPFRFDNFINVLNKAIEGGIPMILRTRLKCIVQRGGESIPRSPRTLERSRAPPSNVPPPIVVMNEVVIDRGPNPYLCQLELYVDHLLATCVQGDGIIISTPTGSTAYAAAAGASMIHPSVPAMVICPICPHSLSFRPIIVPAGVEIQVRISPGARNTAWASFDGKYRQEILHGDCVRITTYKYALPSLCCTDQLTDWFTSLAECLHWNVRKPQKALQHPVGSDASANGSDDSTSN